MSKEELSLTVVTSARSSMRAGRNEQVTRIVEEGISLDTLRANFDRFLSGLQTIVGAREARAGDFVLDEVTFSAEIGADGQFKLLGAGVGVSATSGVTFTLRRHASE